MLLGILGVVGACPLRANPALLGQWPGVLRGGEAQGVVVRDDLGLAYVAAGEVGLLIFDVSDRTRPILRGRLDTAGFAKAVAVEGTRAYVADSDNGLLVVDVANPAGPIFLGRHDTSGLAEDVEVVGTRVYVADGSGGWLIVDATDPANPSRISTVATLGRACGLDVVGGVVYVAEGEAGLQVYDASNPVAPNRMGGLHMPGSALGVRVEGANAFVAAGLGGLRIIGVSNPGTPVAVGSVATVGPALAVRVQAGIAAVAAGEGGFQLIQVSTPAAPVALSTVPTRGGVLGVHLSGPTAYVADLHSGLLLYGVETPGAPTLAGIATVGGETIAVRVVGSRAYVADWNGGLTIVDVSQSSSPVRLGGYGTGTFVSDVEMVGTLAFVADYYDGLVVLDLANPQAPVRLGGYGGISQLTDIHLVGTRVYMAHSAGLEILDISNLANPVRLGGYATDGDVFRVQVVGSTAYLAVHRSHNRPGLQIVAVGNPASPTYLGGYAPPEAIHGLFISGTRAYLAASDAGLLVLNVANPAVTPLMGSVKTLGPAMGVEVTGTLAFVTEGKAGLASYEVLNPAAIVRTGELDTRGVASGVRLSGTLAYVADGIGGLAVVAQSVPVNSPPDFPTIPNVAADEGVPFQLLVSASDAETPSGSLVFDLVEGPSGFSISPFGLMRWTPTEEQGPHFYTIRVSVTDNGSPPESTTNAFQLQVREVNVAPTLPPFDLATIPEEQLLTVQLLGHDSDLPTNRLSYHLVEGPEGMTVSPEGQLVWIPTEIQGPATLLVSVGVTDDGVPPMGSTNFFPVMVLESNKRPVLATVLPQAVDEGTALSVQLMATDDDRPLNTLTYALVNGPEGLTVSPSGLVAWTPTEAQGPMVTTVSVKVTDNGSPVLSATNQFEVTVREVNRVPVLASVATQTVDALVPLSVTLEGTDPDLPANHLVYSRLAGPDGLTVSESGQVAWTPGPGQAPSTNVVRVRVTDDGNPVLSAEREFTVVAWAVEERAIFQIGVDDDPERTPHAEFSQENDVNDLPPGGVTRLAGDPQLDVASNPGADDDYYLRGIYRRGYNQLPEVLLVPNDEPFSAWERAIIPSDRTNRLHFRLTSSQAVPETWIRVVAEFPMGGSAIVRGELIPGFSEHDLAIRIRNAAGAVSDVFTGRLTAPGTVTAEFPLTNVGAVAGPTTLEWVREGPQTPGRAYWLIFDYLRVEIDAGGNEAPLLEAVPSQTVDEGVLWTWTLTGSDPDTPPTPLTFGLVSGPPGLTVSPAGQISWTPTEAQGPESYPVSVRVTDNGIPVRSTTNSFTITVREVNRPPVPVSPEPPPAVNELEPLTLSLAASDPDLPVNELTFALEDGPAGLTVSTAGVLTWTPTEAQGPAVFPVVVQVRDNGVPPLSTPLRFNITVPEVNTPPRLGAVAPQTVDRLAPLDVALVSADDDLPANILTHTLVRGPEGISVSPSGAVRWVPRLDQAPSTNTVVVRVTDNGVPALSAEREFIVVALPVEERAIIQVGVDDDPDVEPYNPRAEFRAENGRVDPAPGAATRVEGDPEFDADSNPAGDDPFYVRGIYPVGYNGLRSRLILPADEPAAAWETALTTTDPANQLHFRLTEAQAAPGGWMRVVTEFAVGGSVTGGQVNPGFAEHDVSIRFRNGSGVVTTVSAGRIRPPARLITEFSLESVGAGAGPNSIEWVRTGPAVDDTSFWLTYDFVRLEIDAGGNEAPVIAEFGDPAVNEMEPWTLSLIATDPDVPPTPLTFALVTGPDGLVISPDGVLTWTPSEAQGPIQHRIAVKVTDNGVPIRSTTNEFLVTVREVNRAPTLAVVADQILDELTELTIPLVAADEDLPPNQLTFTVVSGPEGMTVGADGVITWIPSEAQGPEEYSVVVKVSDNGTPVLEAVREFRVTVREVNTTPAIAEVPRQVVDRLAPLAWSLSGTDSDLPANRLVYSLVEGPEGLTVSAAGAVAWKPGTNQAPSTNVVVVRLSDDGIPPLNGFQEFTVVASAVEERAVFWIGEDDDPDQTPYLPYDEFRPQNDLNDPPPGRATRPPEDPDHIAAGNPGADDDFYVRGNYPKGFNGLGERLVLPFDEPSEAWEFSLNSTDLTNRIHFRLTEAQAVSETWMRVVAEFPVGGSISGGSVLPGFADHDVAVSFRNAVGQVTEVASRRLSAPGLLVAEFNLGAVGAAAGPNTLEWVRTGPVTPGTAYWLNFDYVRIEVDAGGNEAPRLAAVPNQEVDEQTFWTVTLDGTDTDTPPTPLTYSLVSGPEGVVVTPAGVVTWTPSEEQGPSTNIVSVRVTDNGIPVRSTTNQIVVVVREVNREPVVVAVPAVTLNELEPLSLQLTSLDPDFPENERRYSLVTGPEGLSVSPEGQVLWVPQEAQGPSLVQVVVRVADNGIPPLSTTREFEVNVREVNTEPVVAEVPVQHVDRLAPLNVSLQATDRDLPANALAFSLESGPEGASVAPDGRIRWLPNRVETATTNSLVVRISDNGQPPLSVLRTVIVVTWPVEERSVYQLGVDDDPAVPPYRPSAEFSPENGVQDPPPGAVTRTPLDPEYDAGTNPGADDEFFFRGIFPRGHNGLEANIRLSEDEPAVAWEARLTRLDPVNHLHFRLTEVQADPATWMRLVVEIAGGDSGNGATFGEHEIAFRFRNGAGQVTEVFARRVTEPGRLVAEFDAARVGATPGVNVLELVRSGPNAGPGNPGVEFDYVQFEVDAGGNQAPVLAAIPDQVIPEQTTLMLPLDGLDPDVPPTHLTYRLLSGPEGLVVTPEGLLEWTPSEAQGPSTNQVTVEVRDNGVPVLSVSRTFVVVVQEVNRAPVWEPLTQISIPELVLFRRDIVARDPDEPPNSLTYSVIRGPAGLTLSPNGTLSWTPFESQGPSTSTVIVRVSDNGRPSLTVTNEFLISVTEVNSAPTLAEILPQTATEGVAWSVALSGSDSDRPQNLLTYSLVNGPPGLEVSAAGVVTWVPGEDQGGGTAPVVVRVRDNGVPAMEGLREFSITVLEDNQAPVLAEIPTQTLTETNRFRWSLVAEDRDLPRNTLRFVKVSGPAGLTVAPTGEMAWDPSESDGGRSYPVTVRVSDDGNPVLSDEMQFLIEVLEANQPPRIADVPLDPIPENEIFLHVLSVADPDIPINDYEFSLISGPPGLTIGREGLIEWTPSEGQGPSTNTVIVRLTDTGIPPLSTTNQFDLIVLEVNTPPQLLAPGLQTIDERVAWNFALQAVDPDLPANRLEYTLILGPSGLTLSGDGVVSWEPTEGQGPSTNAVVVSVSDGVPGSRRATNRFDVVVREVNHPPALDPVASFRELPGEEVYLILSAVDPDLPRLNHLQFELVSGDPLASVDVQTGEFRWRTQGSGPSEFTIRVLDDGEPRLEDRKTFTIRVGGPDLFIRYDGSQVVLEYEMRPGWKYTLLGLPFDQVDDADPEWSTIVGEKTSTRVIREVIRLPLTTLSPGQVFRVEATPQ